MNTTDLTNDLNHARAAVFRLAKRNKTPILVLNEGTSHTFAFGQVTDVGLTSVLIDTAYQLPFDSITHLWIDYDTNDVVVSIQAP